MERHGVRWWFRYLAILVLGLFLLGCAAQARGEKPLPRLADSLEQDSVPGMEAGAGTGVTHGAGEQWKVIPVVLYFSDNRGYLVAVKKEIPKTQAIARATLQELCRGPAPGSGLNPTIPPGTVLRDINIKNGLAIVDFSRELKAKHWGGSTAELLTVYSIVNTLTQFSSVQRVQILVEGEPLKTLAGHLDTSGPLEREASLIRAREQ
ncbi:GerMN domain-containing protein [Desulfofundulus thermosubterraneus]|uniref:Sporulation and spore germination n=1 Tax=Desulfofundulus thermosubterraneus DSM 16057 TaxID=1121432 RepID=A0A1M6J0F5_9FIRM|nr:GerMN domain-containing protein [Desulfofundulus thermosubterraneus]SHJ40130.1 Sporulation and spore germination [Desulfofundulus thermosubterraneus DSM 16057]